MRVAFAAGATSLREGQLARRKGWAPGFFIAYRRHAVTLASRVHYLIRKACGSCRYDVVAIPVSNKIVSAEHRPDRMTNGSRAFLLSTAGRSCLSLKRYRYFYRFYIEISCEKARQILHNYLNMIFISEIHDL